MNSFRILVYVNIVIVLSTDGLLAGSLITGLSEGTSNSRIRCIQCTATDVGVCSIVTQCFSNQVCSFHETVNEDNRIWYTLGCTYEKACVEIDDPLHCHTAHKRTNSICTRRLHCCNHDLCNLQFAKNMTLPHSTVATPVTTPVIPSQQTTTMTTRGTSLVTTSGTQHQQLTPNKTTTQPTTVSTTTTGLNRQLECYECFYVNNVFDCENKRICNKNEVCYLMRVNNDAFHSGQCFYKLGCLQNSTCAYYFKSLESSSPISTVYGDVTDFIECCGHSGCNRHHEISPSKVCTQQT